MKKVTAIFKGKNDSLGYKTNGEYTLSITHKTKTNIEIKDLKSGGGRCEYSSVVSFLNNWDNVQRV